MMKPSPKEEDPANWLGQLKRFASDKQTLTRAGVIASSFVLRELVVDAFGVSDLRESLLRH